MKKRLSSKFNNKGETIIEMLVSVLIGALATAMLATTIANSISVTRKLDAYDEQLRTDIELAESRSPGNSVNGTVTIGSSSQSVIFYGNERLMTFQPNGGSSN